MRQTLQQARKAAGKKQREIAMAIGISERMYQQIETGHREGKGRVWDALEAFFGISQRQLRENGTHPNYSKNAPDGEAEARELYDAVDGLKIDAEAVLDVAKDGRLDDLKDREILVRARDAINAVLGEVA